MLFPVFAGHFHFIGVREHPDLVDSLMRAPHDQRNLHTDRHLNWKNRLTSQTVPIHATHLIQCTSCDSFDFARFHHHHHSVAIEKGLQVCKITDAYFCVVVLVIGHQERVHPINFFDRMDDEIGIPRAAYRNYTIVSTTRFAAKLLKYFGKLMSTHSPVQGVLFLMNATTAANSFFIEGPV